VGITLRFIVIRVIRVAFAGAAEVIFGRIRAQDRPLESLLVE
jgi:hypothetical protein